MLPSDSSDSSSQSSSGEKHKYIPPEKRFPKMKFNPSESETEDEDDSKPAARAAPERLQILPGEEGYNSGPNESPGTKARWARANANAKLTNEPTHEELLADWRANEPSHEELLLAWRFGTSHPRNTESDYATMPPTTPSLGRKVYRIQFVEPPYAQARAKISQSGSTPRSPLGPPRKKAHMRDPMAEAKGQFQKSAIKTYLKDEKTIPVFGKGVPVTMAIWLCFPRPKSDLVWNNEHREFDKKDIEWMPHMQGFTGVPDIDNCLKFYMDCMNGLYYHDDRQVVAVHVYKVYDDFPWFKGRVIIKLMETLEREDLPNAPMYAYYAQNTDGDCDSDAGLVRNTQTLDVKIQGLEEDYMDPRSNLFGKIVYLDPKQNPNATKFIPSK